MSFGSYVAPYWKPAREAGFGVYSGLLEAERAFGLSAFESNATVDIEIHVRESAPNAPMSTQDRYDVIMDPTDTWTVWDLINDEPAMFGDHVLAALTQAEAMAARDVMNDAWRRLQESALNKRTDAA